jgi:hypothetical protein
MEELPSEERPRDLGIMREELEKEELAHAAEKWRKVN